MEKKNHFLFDRNAFYITVSKMIQKSLIQPNCIKRSLLFLSFILLLYCFISCIGSITVYAKKYEVSDLVFEDSQFLMVDGVELHYRIWLPKDDINRGNVLLVHGLGGSTYSWRYTVTALIEKGYRAVSVDLPGFGLSQRKPAVNQSHENRATLLWRFIGDLKLKGTWHLVGHSMGGGIVAAMALKKPYDAASIILVDGSIEGRISRFLSLISRSRLLRTITGKLISRLIVTRRKIKSFLRSAYGREPNPEDVEGYYLPLRVKNTYLTMSYLLKKYPSDEKLLDDLDTIRVPVLCLWGSEDEWVPVDRGEELIKKIPEASLFVIDEAKHCPMETHPELFNSTLLQFLDKN